MKGILQDYTTHGNICHSILMQERILLINGKKIEKIMIRFLPNKNM